ncbi:MAG TPA: cohesin domain-containing protein [Candidatus Acidoferrales bacterium]|nr:cohesin domain-containing protein [Candidatus Acidoferrales bacterium]
MRKPFKTVLLLACATLFLTGCPKGTDDFKAGKKAETLQDFDTAFVHYQRALRADPDNINYRLKVTHLRFEAGQAHVTKGQKLREKGELQLAVAEFEKAASIDPSSAVATQELKRTMDMLAERQGQPAPTPLPEGQEPEAQLLEKPPELAPLSREPINLRLTNDARIIYDTIGKLAGISVLYDPDFQPRRISTELTNVTLEQALDVVALQSKTFWKPVASNIIFVVPDQQQKRRDYEEFIVKTFYLSNTVQAQDLTEIVNGLRQLFDFRRINQVNSQNAIIIRDTPDKIAMAEKIIRDVDKAKPEVIIQVAVLQARRDRARDLGIEPGTSATLAFTPRNPTGGTTGGTGTSTSTSSQIRLSDLQRLSSADYSVTLPGAKALALMTDSTTKIIQNPEIRAVDGQSAKLRVGDRVPIATGSFSAGLGGTTPTVGGVINPLVNTQFQYQEVGVNIDFTPRVHANREVSLKVSIEVSSVTGRTNIGGIEQPIISQRKIEHDVRLREGEVNVLGGLVEESQTKSLSGWPGLSKIPFLRYFFSSESIDKAENEVLIVLTPRIVRLPDITAANLRSVSAGTEANPQVRRVGDVAPPAPAQPAPQTRPPAGAQPPVAQPPAGAPTTQPPAATPEARPARLRFEPATLTLKPGETTTINVVVEDVKDLFSIPMLLQYNPAVISVEEVRHGGFLSGGTQDIAIVQNINKEKGQAIISATRQPNTQGIGGSGTLVGVVLRGVAAGTSKLQIVQVNARNSAQQSIQLVTGEANIQVQ